MESIREINLLVKRSFSLVKFNMVLILPFLIYWLLLGFVLFPLTSAGGFSSMIFTFFLVIAITSAFIAGWHNMFKKCVETVVDENQPDEKRTEDSFRYLKEFFPGVGQFFLKITLGIVMYFFIFNVLMLLLELFILPFFGGFDSFTQQEMAKALETPDLLIRFWENISDADKTRLLTIAGLEALFTMLFLYFTMFWTQLIILKDIYPLKSLWESFKLVTSDYIKTAMIFFVSFALIFILFFVGGLFVSNPIIKLLVILLFVWAVVFYIMLTFLYLERHVELPPEIVSH